MQDMTGTTRTITATINPSSALVDAMVIVTPMAIANAMVNASALLSTIKGVTFPTDRLTVVLTEFHMVLDMDLDLAKDITAVAMVALEATVVDLVAIVSLMATDRKVLVDLWDDSDKKSNELLQSQTLNYYISISFKN
jgi:hypothetical protein